MMLHGTKVLLCGALVLVTACGPDTTTESSVATTTADTGSSDTGTVETTATALAISGGQVTTTTVTGESPDVREFIDGLVLRPGGAAASESARNDTVARDETGVGTDLSATFREAAELSAGTSLAGILPLTPGRLLDTRSGIGARTGPVGESSSLELAVLGRFGVPPTGVDAVVLNVTVTEPTAESYVTIWPTGASRPETSNLNMTPGLTIANLVVVKVGSGGLVSLFNRFGSTHLVADVVGYSSSAEHLQSLLPDRILDTRIGVGAPTGKVPANSSIDVMVLGRGGVPASGVGSIIVNVTVTAPTAESYVTVWPTGFARPEASNLNMSADETRPNLVIAKVGAGGRISLFNRFGSTHLVGDVVGWIPEHGAYTAINPTRILDTRSGVGAYGTPFFDRFLGTNILRPGIFDGPVGPGRTIAVTLKGAAGVPEDATALVLNVTAVGATEPTYITSWPFGEPMPTASSINVTPGDTAPNMVIVERGGGDFWLWGEEYFNLFNSSGRVHLIADIVGYFVPRNAQDQPDATANTIHIVIASPSDVPSSVTEAGALQTMTAAEQWLQTHGGRGLRFDTDAAGIEVSRLTFGRTRQELGEADVFDEVYAGGFTAPSKKYLVFVEGVSTSNTGIADYFGSVALVFGGSTEVNTAQTPNSFIPLLVLHELFHTMGAVSDCAPSSTFQGHVVDANDLMAPTIDPMLTTLDPGRDDYWGQGDGNCLGEPYPDISLNPALD